MENNSADSVDSKVVTEPKIPPSVDKIDARKEFNIFKKKSSTSQQSQSSKPNIQPTASIDDECIYYDMNNEKRGWAIILNHFKFDSIKYRSENRNGTEIDCQRLHKTLSDLGFKVKTYDDLTRIEINQKLKKAADVDHRNSDCIIVIVLSHGGDKGSLEARDGSYDINDVWEPFLSSGSLIGKPKLFFIQACRGTSTDPGIMVMSKASVLSKGDMVDSLGSKPKQFLIPSMADLLVMYSTYEGHYAWRNRMQGSCFIQALCDEFEENGKSDDLLRLLTGVCRRVAFTFQSNVPDNSNMDAMKQMPSIVSMLTKILYFTKKIEMNTSDTVDTKNEIKVYERDSTSRTD